MKEWLASKAFQALTGLKHQEFRFLSNLQHRDLANGNFTVIGYDGSQGQHTDDKLLKEGYSRNAQAYSIIRKISETGSDIPWQPVEVMRDGTIEPITEGRFYDFVMNPNEEQTIKDFKEISYTYFLTTGDLFWRRIEAIGFTATRELMTLPSQLIEVLTNQNEPLKPSGYQFELGRTKEKFTLEEIIHQQYVNPTTRGIESLRGMSPLSASWLTLSGDNQRAEAQDAMMKNRGAAGIVTNESDTPMMEDDRKIQQGLFDKMFGGAKNFNRIIAGKSSAKFLQLGMSSNDLKILETGIENLRTLCNVYGAPSELFNDPANKTFANQKTALKAFYENAVLPVDRRLLSKYNREIVTEWSEQDGKNYQVVQDLEHIGALQEDEEKKAAKAEKVINSIMKVVAEVKNGLDPEAAANIIAHSHDMTKDEAMNFVTLLNQNQDNE